MVVYGVTRSRLGILGVWLGFFGVACGDSAEDEPSEAEGRATGAECPANSALTYANFGQAFMEKYCTRCHSSALTAGERQGAPSDHNFDDLLTIRALADHIDEHAAAGPEGVNEAMPLNGTKPTELERTQLGEWLACGSPS